ncbi:hypothetical protein J2Z42_000624 [Clostridium algifaecis]|uniref:Uncharacterized protein n=1 Tax=Clostridium algifaecis TaxID=1472040 RepID=A0ABS4KSY3_9CLOT|nr:hypothetical protein [Clostridium algifaecis]
MLKVNKEQEPKFLPKEINIVAKIENDKHELIKGIIDLA